MSGPEIVLLALAGIGGGLAGSIGGLASLVSYPALLATGLSPVSANIANTVSMVFSGVGATAGSRHELRGQGAALRRLALASAAGGAAGSALLLLTPSGAFRLAVPWLIGGASLIMLVRPRPGRDAARRPLGLVVAVFAIAVYGGYFGAAAGVVLLAFLLHWSADTLPRINAAKNVLLGTSNAVAAIAFALTSNVHWTAVAPLAAGLLVGARAGPIVVRHSPANLLRTLIALGGIGLAITLGIQAYS